MLSVVSNKCVAARVVSDCVQARVVVPRTASDVMSAISFDRHRLHHDRCGC
jgi:hypothetical protein